MWWPYETVQPITWEAIATLVTGLLAVGAAWLIGHRQVALLNNQHESQKRQSQRDLDLREQEVRITLLDRRIKHVEDLRDIWSSLTFDGIENFSQFDLAALQRLAQQSEYLFPHELHVRLLDTWELLSNCCDHNRSIKRLGDRGDQDGLAREIDQRHKTYTAAKNELREIISEFRKLRSITIARC
jgi:hypothetical protein